MKERLKNIIQGTLSVCEYKNSFDKLVEYFPNLFDKDKQIFFVIGLQNSIKYDVKALKLYTLEKYIALP